MYINIIDSTMLSDGIINSFNKYLPETIFYINGNYSGKESNVISTNFGSLENLLFVVDEINKYNEVVVIIHFMNSQKKYIIDHLKPNAKVVWCIWGYDLYESNSSFINFPIYDSLTEKYIKSNRNFLSTVKKQLKETLNKLSNKDTLKQKFIEFSKKVDAISYIVPSEEILIKNLGINKPSLLLYHDPSYLEFTSINKFDLNNKNNILIGNSGALSNNHLDAFKILENKNLHGKKIIVPLSYGGNQKYIDYVIEVGKKQFGDKFQPLLTRLSLEEYSNLLETCGIVVFNHKRQQAVGNLLSLLGRGTKVIFNKENPVYQYYLSYGMHLENIEQFSLNTLTVDQAIENQNIIKQIYNESRLKQEFEKLKSI